MTIAVQAAQQESDTLRTRLAEAEEMLRAIREGEIDALVVEGDNGNQVYTLHSADEPYRNLVEQMQEGAVVLGLTGGIVYCNARFAELVGEPIHAVVGSRFDRFVNAPDREGFEAAVLAGTGRVRSRLVRLATGALEVSLSIITTASTSGDRLNVIVTDLSELLEATSNRARAERDSRTKDEFLTMLAHELRTPLGAITNAVQVVEKTHAQGERAVRAHDVIARQVGHISHLINDMLDVERVVSGKVRLNREPLDLGEVARRAVAAFVANPGLNRRIEVTTESVWVDGDPERLQQVLANIITNAVKYTPAGGHIAVKLRAQNGDAVLTVEDSGYGISAKLMPFIFDLYVQADRTLDRAQGGLGIGLTLVRRLVELHAGTIVASSEGEGYGSRFTLRLKEIPAAVAFVGISSLRDGRATPRRVLLIEDNADAREMLRMMLELAGHAVYDAPDGARGLELLSVVRPDVAIIDIGLPRMDGYQVARRIREDAHGRGMLLVALTGYSSAGDIERSSSHGFDVHLVKPVDPDQLARLLEGVEAV